MTKVVTAQQGDKCCPCVAFGRSFTGCPCDCHKVREQQAVALAPSKSAIWRSDRREIEMALKRVRLCIYRLSNCLTELGHALAVDRDIDELKLIERHFEQVLEEMARPKAARARKGH